MLITGSNGLVGNALCSELRQRGVDIVEIARDDVAEIDGNTDWGNHLNGINVVVHLAGQTHVLSEFADNPKQEFIRINTDGTRRLAKAVQTAGAARFILLSSALVHGNVSDGESFTENRPVNPQSDYA